MRSFIVKLCLFVSLLFSVGLCIEFYISHKLGQGNRYYFQGDWHDLKNHNPDVLFVGNSRTWVHCDPFIVQKRFNIKAEVLAQDGQTIHVLWLKFKEFLKTNKPPKELYLQFDNNFLVDDTRLYGFKTFSTGFFMDRIDFRSLKNWDGYSDFFRFIPILAIEPKTIMKVVLNDTVSREDSYEFTYGFKSQDDKWRGENWHEIQSSIFEIKRVSNYLDSFVNTSKLNGIKLYTLFSPQSPAAFNGIVNKYDFDKLNFRYSKNYGMEIQFLNYNGKGVFNDSNYFYNHLHLNTAGVKFFMNELVNDTLSFRSFR